MNCPCCSVAKHKDESCTYSHAYVTLGIVHPTDNAYYPIMVEAITPQDGHEKQDCEQAALHRLLRRFRAEHKTVKATVLTDSIHSKQPTLLLCNELRLNYILACKPGSHLTTFDWVNTARCAGDLEQMTERFKKGGFFGTRQCTWMTNVPIRDSNDAVRVNFISVIEEDPVKGKQTEFTYVTNLSVNRKNVIRRALAGRKRWKIENECHNTLKNQGYCLEHNYGHGSQHLHFAFTMLIFLAYLFHELLKLVNQDGLSQLMKRASSRVECFEEFRVTLKRQLYLSWDVLYEDLKSWDTS